METDNITFFKGIAEEGSREAADDVCGSFLAPDSTSWRKRGDNLRKTWNGSEAQQRRKYLQACAEAGQLQPARVGGSGEGRADGWRHKLASLGGRGGGVGNGVGSGKDSVGRRRNDLLPPPGERLVPLVPRPATRLWDATSYCPGGNSSSGYRDGLGAVVGKSWRKLEAGDGDGRKTAGGCADENEIELVKIDSGMTMM
ncbi:hypothetical protein ElyMa_000161300 [Elysia marginata]|uniref:ACB domain-containing protein n=1 Tax=Elysia marginata TaxID=1093978 RepID=A0AAV4ES95_9GAST|nr:hypothetical protein ElyMa_000161300 [Elysia marginata]